MAALRAVTLVEPKGAAIDLELNSLAKTVSTHDGRDAY
jgi:hypothetical protein